MGDGRARVQRRGGEAGRRARGETYLFVHTGKMVWERAINCARLECYKIGVLGGWGLGCDQGKVHSARTYRRIHALWSLQYPIRQWAMGIATRAPLGFIYEATS